MKCKIARCIASLSDTFVNKSVKNMPEACSLLMFTVTLKNIVKDIFLFK